MTDPSPSASETLPLVEERLSVAKRVMETGRVTVSTRPVEDHAWIRQDLERVEAQVERVSMDQILDAAPEPRLEGDVLIIPVVEEVLVVEKRLRLVEEIRVTRRRTTETVEEAVPVRRTEAVVERRTPDGTLETSPSTQERTS